MTRKVNNLLPFT